MKDSLLEKNNVEKERQERQGSQIFDALDGVDAVVEVKILLGKEPFLTGSGDRDDSDAKKFQSFPED